MSEQVSRQSSQLYKRLEPVAPILTVIILAATATVLVIAPVLAWQWAHVPFPGFAVEPTLLVAGGFDPQWEGMQKGLENLDRLVSINGQPVRGTTGLNDTLSAYRVGQLIVADFVKAKTGEPLQLPLTLQDFLGQMDFIWFFVVPYIVGLIYLGFGLWVFRARYRQAVGCVFALMCCGMALTTGLYFDLYTTHGLSWAWTAGIPLAGGGLIALAHLFPQEQRLVSRWKAMLWLPFVFSALLVMYGWATVYDMARPQAYVWAWRLGYFYGGLGIVSFVGMVTYRRYSSPSPIVRQQGRVILWGALLAFLPAFIFVARSAAGLPTNVVPWIYLLPLIVFPLAIAYAIMRYGALDIDRVVSRSVGYMVLTGSVVGIYFLLINGLGLALHSTVRADSPWIVAGFILVIAVVLDPLRARLQERVDRFFYRGRADYRGSLQAFSEHLSEVVEAERIPQALYAQVNQSMYPSNLWVYLYAPEAGGYIASSIPNAFPPPPGASRFLADGALARALAETRAPIYVQLDRVLPHSLADERERLELLGALLFVPLRGGRSDAGRRIEGWIALGNKQSGQPYTHEDLDFLLALADQAKLALDKARIFTDLDRRVQELSVLSLVGQALNFDLNLDDIFELIYTQTSKILSTTNFYIALHDDRRQVLRFAFYVDGGERLYPDDEWTLGTGLSSEVVRTGNPIVTDDYLAECERRGVIPGGTPGRAWMTVPLLAGDRVLGVMNVSDFDPNVVYSDEQLRFFRTVADYTANVLEKNRLYREMEQRAQQLSILNEVGRAISSTLDLRTALNLIIEKAAEILHAEAASLFLVDLETEELIFEVAMGPTAPDLLGTRMPKGKGIVGTVAQTLKPTIVNNVASDSRWFGGYDKSGEFVTQALIAVPMISKDRAIGVIEVLNKLDGTAFDEDDQNLLQAFAAQSAVAIENARLYTMTDAALARRLEELQTLQRIDRDLNASLDVEHALDVTVQWAIRGTDAVAGMLGVVTPEGDGLLLHAIHGYGDELERYRAEPWPLQRNTIGRVVELGFPNMVPDVNDDPDYVSILPGTKSQLTVPVARENRVIGVIVLESEQVSGFNLEHLNFVVRLADHAAVAISNSQLYEEVKRANEYKSEFVSVVAHELKLPMQNIKGYGDLLAKGVAGVVTEMQSQFLGIIRSNVDRMNTLVSDLLDISRIETGRMRLDLQPMPIRDVVEEVQRTLTRAIEEKQQTLEVDVPENLPPVMGDRSRLIQILTNMVSNAYKYTPSGGHIWVKVSIENRNGHSHVICAVTDNGVGIAPEDVARLGQKFFRASDQRVRDVPGHGLGLSIVKNLIQMHGGELAIESQVGKGSTFSFNVPAAT